MSRLQWLEQAITRKHDRRSFDCGHDDLNRFLANHARQAHDGGAAKTYCAVEPVHGTQVFGFYTLLPTAIEFEAVPQPARPSGGGRHPLGGFRLARLAVDRRLQGQGLGGALLVAAARRCIRVSAEVGGTLLVIDAKDARAAAWYQAYGGCPIPGLPLTLVLPYAVVIKAMGAIGG